jgi:hypothetical protein
LTKFPSLGYVITIKMAFIASIATILLTTSFTFALDTLLFAGCVRMGETTVLPSFEDSLKSVLSPRLLNYGLILADSAKISKGEVCYPSASRFVMRCNITEGADLRIRFSVVAKKDEDSYDREIIWEPSQTVRQNLTLVCTKLIRLFEDNLLARVQLSSEPSYANLVIDETIKAITPFETFLPLGRHDFKLELEGHDKLEVREVVAPGNNRFSFLLKPIQKPLEKAAPIVIREKESSTLPWFIAGGVLFTIGVIAQGFYVKTDNEYDKLISNDVSAYNNLNREAERWLLFRNVTLTSCSITSLYAVYKKFINN